MLPLGWATRNLMRTGVFTVSSVAGTNLLMYRAAGALAITDDYDFRDALRDRQDELLDDADTMIEHAEHVEDRSELPHAVQARYFGKIGRNVLLHHPMGAVLITLHGIEMNLFDSDWEAMSMVSPIPPTIVKMTLDAFTHIEFLLVIVGVAAIWRRDRALAIFVALTLMYFIVIGAGGESEARFRVPVMPIYAIAAALSVRAWRPPQ
jgi:hypothetical protein